MRKWMSLLESNDEYLSDKQILEILSIYEDHFTGDNIHVDPKTGAVSVDNNVTNKGRWKSPTFPVKFGDINGSFVCDSVGLETLENGPVSVNGNYYVDVNNLISLKHLPKGNIQSLAIANNNPILENFEGIELDSEIIEIYATYALEIPLLRFLVVKDNVQFTNNENEQVKKVEDILNVHIQTYSNLKERIIKCQYALIKAGFKDNAKW
jgi:hypothetical protein